MNDEEKKLVHGVSVHIRIATNALGLEGADEAGVLIQEVTGHLVIVAHIDGVNECVGAVSGSEGCNTNVSVGPGKPSVARFAAVPPNGEVLRVRTAVVPAR